MLCSGIEGYTGSRQAHEYYRAWSEVSTIATRIGGPVSMGLEAMSEVWGHADAQARVLYAATVVFGWSEDGASTTALVSHLSEHLLRAVRTAGERELVCAGSSPCGGGPLATCGDIAAADGRGAPFLDGASGAVAVMAPTGSTIVRAVLSGDKYGASLA